MILKVFVPFPTKLYYFAVIVRVLVRVYYLHALVMPFNNSWYDSGISFHSFGSIKIK